MLAGMHTEPSQIERDLRAWDAIEDHRTGSPGDAATNLWLCEQIAQAGAQADTDWFDFTQRCPGSAFVSDGEHRVEGLPCFDGPQRDATPLSGPAGPLGSHAAIAICRFPPGGSADLETARRRTDHQAIVAISTAEQIIPGLAVQNAESFRQPFGPPVLQVPSQAAHWLLDAADNGLDLELAAQLTAVPASAANIQTTIAGKHPELPALIIMTPKSAWWTCTAERGGGICAWLACLRHFIEHRPTRNVMFTANTGHELSHLGLDHLTDKHPDLVVAAHAWLHLGANFAACNGHLLWQASDPAWLARGQQQIESLTGAPIGLTAVGQRPLGEARNVFDAGGTFVSLLGSNQWFHHPEDRLGTSVDVARTARLCNFVVEVADELAGP